MGVGCLDLKRMPGGFPVLLYIDVVGRKKSGGGGYFYIVLQSTTKLNFTPRLSGTQCIGPKVPLPRIGLVGV